jgi:hypothetical protein
VLPAGLTWNGCNATWKNITNTAVGGMVLYAQYITVDDCLSACALTPSCVAAQVRNATSPPQCFFVSDTNYLHNQIPSVGVNLFILIAKCSTGGGEIIFQQYNIIVHCA